MRYTPILLALLALSAHAAPDAPAAPATPAGAPIAPAAPAPVPASKVAPATRSMPDLYVTVIHGNDEPLKYHYELNEQRREIDIRKVHRYDAAFRVPKTKEEICRQGEYKTGLMFTARYVPSAKKDGADVLYPIEIIGQISNLKDSKPGLELSCGRNTEIEMDSRGISDTVFVKPNRQKGVVIDNNWTIFLTVTP